MSASTLDEDHGATQESVVRAVESADGFAQVFPQHKFRIVQLLQQARHIVGMTGDGVNDAPALKQADAGIAVSGATDAARAAADVVLLTPGLSIIVDAIRESRKMFRRMNSYAIYRIAETTRVLLFMTLAILVFNFYPVTTVMLVLLAILNDGAILSIAYDRVQYADHPEAWNMPRRPEHRDRARRHGRRRHLRPLLHGRAAVPSDTAGRAVADVPEAVGRRPPDDLRDPHARSVLDRSAGGRSLLGRRGDASPWRRCSRSTACSWPRSAGGGGCSCGGTPSRGSW